MQDSMREVKYTDIATRNSDSLEGGAGGEQPLLSEYEKEVGGDGTMHMRRATRSSAAWRRNGLALTVALLLLVVIFLSSLLVFGATTTGQASLSELANRISSHALGKATSAATRPKEAIAVLMTHANWLPQLAVMTYGLKHHSPNRDKVLIVPDYHNNTWDIPTDSWRVIEQKLGWKVKLVPHLEVPANQWGETTPWSYHDVMNKIHIWNMTEYDAVAMFDLDTLVVGDLDTSFDLLHTSNTSLASVPDEIYNYDWQRMSPQGGSMWAKPNEQLFDEMVDFKNDTSKYDIRWPEQLMLNRFFWGRWLVLPSKYGLQIVFATHDELDEMYAAVRKDARMLHFTGGNNKPWDESRDKESKPSLQADKLLWREALKSAIVEFKLEEADLTQNRDIGMNITRYMPAV